MWGTSGSIVGHIQSSYFFVDQWLKWVNRSDPLSTLLAMYYHVAMVQTMVQIQ